MRFSLLLLISLICSSQAALAESPSCNFSAQRARLLALNYHAFDQTLPNGGWRGLPRNCKREIAELIDLYRDQNRRRLKAEEIAVLNFHAGQFYAENNQTELALTRFRVAFDPTLNTKWNWDYLVHGTIAFLENNRVRLEELRRELVQKSPNDTYVPILDHLLSCIGRSYGEQLGRYGENTEACAPRPAGPAEDTVVGAPSGTAGR